MNITQWKATGSDENGKITSKDYTRYCRISPDDHELEWFPKTKRIAVEITGPDDELKYKEVVISTLKEIINNMF